MPHLHDPKPLTDSITRPDVQPASIPHPPIGGGRRPQGHGARRGGALAGLPRRVRFGREAITSRLGSWVPR